MNRLSHLFACIISITSLAVAGCAEEESNNTPNTPTTTDDGGADDASNGNSCTAARETALGPIDKVSTGEVKTLEVDGATKTIYVDASAGGNQQQASEPRIYVNLEAGAREDLSDIAAETSTAWDLALKRSTLFVNGGHGGPGQGAVVAITGKSEESITAADATELEPEQFFDDTCTAIPDKSGRGVKTTFDDWYDYNMDTHQLSPADIVYVVRGGTGKLFKVRILSFNANPDGTDGQTTGRFVLRVTSLDNGS